MPVIALKSLLKYTALSKPKSNEISSMLLFLSSKSVTEIKNQARINYAKELLSSGFYNVSETARECGFLDVNYFVRFFKSKTGIAPRKYREELLYPTTK